MLRTSTVCCELPPPSTPGGAKIFFFFAPDGELGQEEVQGISPGTRGYRVPPELLFCIRTYKFAAGFASLSLREENDGTDGAKRETR